MAIGYLYARASGATIAIPVVSLGASPLASKVRVKVPAGVGELPLVYPDDVRASPIRVRQGGVTYAVAKDERTEISYSPDKSVSVSGPHGQSGKTSSVLIARTYFNRVTRIEATLRVGANSYCTTWDIDSHFEQTTGYGWIRAVGPTTVESSKVSITAGGHHGGFQSWWQTGWKYTTGSVAIDVPAGTYDVYLYVQYTWSGTWHSGSTGEASATCQMWKEIARG